MLDDQKKEIEELLEKARSMPTLEEAEHKECEVLEKHPGVKR